MCSAALAIACSPGQREQAGASDGKPAAAASTAGVRPNGDTEIQADLARVPADLKKVYDHIDANIVAHVENLQKWIRQPSVSNSGEGIPESAEMVRGFFEELGCQESRVYEVPMTEYGTPGNPVVYARCDEGAPRTLLIYWMYDTMPITQPDAWMSPPFEARLVQYRDFPKVVMGRGATNSKGPQMAQLNALRAIKAVHGKLPVNLIVVAEGDEERMSIGLRQFVKDHPDLFKQAEAMYRFGSQSYNGGGELSGGSEGCVYIELTTSGKRWGRGPVDSDIHGANKRSVDSPAWRHIKMLSTLVSEDGNTPLIAGFADNVDPLKAGELEKLKQQAALVDMVVAARNLGVARFIADDPLEYLKMGRYGLSFNMDGIWGGNMYAGGAGAILPNRITSKHNMRYVPNMDGMDLTRKVRAHLDKHGFKDVAMKVIGDVPWSKQTYDTDVARALRTTYDIFQIRYTAPPSEPSILGPYWPAYLFAQQDSGLAPARQVAAFGGINMPIVGGAAGHGGNAHAANEYYVIEGKGRVYGLAGAEKSVATVLWAFAGKIKPAPPTTTE
jgi:acetylornithine deacetylase/succinyl-diaminopimelate desuccinylase-like protein